MHSIPQSVLQQLEVLGFKLSTWSKSVQQAIEFSQLYWYMIAFMAEKQIYGASIIIQISLKNIILLQALYKYTATPSMVIRVTAIDTHGS